MENITPQTNNSNQASTIPEDVPEDILETYSDNSEDYAILEDGNTEEYDPDSGGITIQSDKPDTIDTNASDTEKNIKTVINEMNSIYDQLDKMTLKANSPIDSLISKHTELKETYDSDIKATQFLILLSGLIDKKIEECMKKINELKEIERLRPKDYGGHGRNIHRDENQDHYQNHAGLHHRIMEINRMNRMMNQENQMNRQRHQNQMDRLNQPNIATDSQTDQIFNDIHQQLNSVYDDLRSIKNLNMFDEILSKFENIQEKHSDVINKYYPLLGLSEKIKREIQYYIEASTT